MRTRISLATVVCMFVFSASAQMTNLVQIPLGSRSAEIPWWVSNPTQTNAPDTWQSFETCVSNFNFLYSLVGTSLSVSTAITNQWRSDATNAAAAVTNSAVPLATTANNVSANVTNAWNTSATNAASAVTNGAVKLPSTLTVTGLQTNISDIFGTDMTNSGWIQASGFSGSASGLTSIPAVALTGTSPQSTYPVAVTNNDTRALVLNITGLLTNGISGNAATATTATTANNVVVGITNSWKTDSTNAAAAITNGAVVLPGALTVTGPMTNLAAGFGSATTNTGWVSASGFSGSGSGLTALPAAQLTGTAPQSTYPAAWTNNNSTAMTASNNFTIDATHQLTANGGIAGSVTNNIQAVKTNQAPIALIPNPIVSGVNFTAGNYRWVLMVNAQLLNATGGNSMALLSNNTSGARCVFSNTASASLNAYPATICGNAGDSILFTNKSLGGTNAIIVGSYMWTW